MRSDMTGVGDVRFGIANSIGVTEPANASSVD